MQELTDVITLVAVTTILDVLLVVAILEHCRCAIGLRVLYPPLLLLYCAAAGWCPPPPPPPSLLFLAFLLFVVVLSLLLLISAGTFVTHTNTLLCASTLEYRPPLRLWTTSCTEMQPKSQFHDDVGVWYTHLALRSPHVFSYLGMTKEIADADRRSSCRTESGGFLAGRC